MQKTTAIFDSDGDGYRESNWATAWQDSHVQNQDWWASGAAHSQHLNGNRKGYAAWWLWARLGGWYCSDTDMDRDVDGADLAELASGNPDDTCVEKLSATFGEVYSQTDSL